MNSFLISSCSNSATGLSYKGSNRLDYGVISFWLSDNGPLMLHRLHIGSLKLNLLLILHNVFFYLGRIHLIIALSAAAIYALFY